jgi:hypothetical protein
MTKRVVLFPALTVAVAAGLIISCTEKKPTEPGFVISATSGAYGAISPLGSVSVRQGASQSFVCIPDSGYEVVNLRVDGISLGPVATYTFTEVSANHYIYASFSHIYQITASAGLHGTISPSGNVSVIEGANQPFTITPDFGYQISDVVVDGESVGAVTSYAFANVSIDHTISAVFTLIPFVLGADNGLYYRGSMNSSVLTPQLVLSATDSAGASANQWIKFNLLSGDGAFAADSVQTDAFGKAQPVYSFTGSKGHALIEAVWPDKDTLKLNLRASALVWGDSAQGQYVRIGDRYSFVKAFIGQPERVDVDPNYWLTYAVYETSQDVVVILNDLDQDGGASSFETVYGIIVNGGYSGTFFSGIGIGSTVGAVDTAFGAPDTMYFDTTTPASWVYVYRTEGITFFANQAIPRLVFEIHLIAPSATQPYTARRFRAPVSEK